MKKYVIAIAIILGVSATLFAEASASENLLYESQAQAAATDEAGYLDWAVENVRRDADAPQEVNSGNTVSTTTVTVVTQVTTVQHEPEPQVQPEPALVVQPAPAPVQQPAAETADGRPIVNVNVNIQNIWRRIPVVRVHYGDDPAPVQTPVAQPATPAVPAPQNRSAFGGFGGPVCMATHIGGSPVLLTGGQGAMIFNHTLILGGAGYSLASRDDKYVDNYTFQNISLGYGGAYAGLRLFGKRSIHITFSALAGFGSMGYSEDGVVTTKVDFNSRSPFFVLEPGVELGITFFKFIELSAGVTYRHVYGFDGFDVFEAKDLEGYSAQLAVSFGAF